MAEARLSSRKFTGRTTTAKLVSETHLQWGTFYLR